VPYNHHAIDTRRTDVPLCNPLFYFSNNAVNKRDISKKLPS
jgi:hypothetical protein